MKNITNNNYINDIKINNIYKGKSNIKKMYEIVNIYLNELYRANSISLVKVYKKAFLIDKSKKGIYMNSCSSEEIENNIINCSLNLTGNFPIAQTVLYCNSSTIEEEIISFIYRSVLCELKVLFILIKPEILDIEKKNLLIQLLKELFSEGPFQMKSCLLIVYTTENKNKEIIIEIKNYQIIIFIHLKMKTISN